jgi:TnpA family transposase
VTTDTAGFTELLFGAYDLVGLGFSPRIRNLADQRLWHLDDTALPTLAEPLVANRINTGRIMAHWATCCASALRSTKGRYCRRCY